MSARHRVLVESLAGAAAGDGVEVGGEGAHHLARVVRVRVGEAVVAFDGAGLEASARITALEASGRQPRVSLTLTDAPHAGVTWDAAGVCLLQGYPKGDKLDTIVRQATELGVRAICPVYTARSVPRPKGAGPEERLARIAASAAAQCGRADVPEVGAASDLARALAALDARTAVRLLAWEEGGVPLGEALAAAPAQGWSAVLVGPEGGLEAAEVELARGHGFVPVSLGPRIWRTETAGPALLAMLSLARGDLRPGNR